MYRLVLPAIGGSGPAVVMTIAPPRVAPAADSKPSSGTVGAAGNDVSPSGVPDGSTSPAKSTRPSNVTKYA